MAAITNELVTNFSFQGSLAPLEKYNANFTNAIGLMTKAVGVVTAVTGAMYTFANAQFTAIDNMGQLSRETNFSIESLQKWGYIASVNGGSIESLQSSVRGLSEKIGEASIQGSEDFARLGISVRKANGEVKSTEEVLNEIRGAFQGLEKSQQISFAQKLGIDKGLLQTLNLTNSQIAQTSKIVEKLGIVTEEETNKVIAFKDSLFTSKFALNAIADRVSINMLPNMQKLITSFNDFLIANGNLIKNGLSKTIEIMSSFVGAVVNTGKVILEGIDYFIGLKNAAYIAGGAVLYFNRVLLANPIVRVGTYILGLIAIVDDLKVAFNGGQSVIKDFFASFDIDIVKTLKTVFDGLKITFNGLLIGLINISKAFTDLVLLGAKAGNFLGLNIDTKGIEEFKKIQEQTKLNLSSENQRLGNEIMSRNYSTSQNITINQNIQGQEAERIADLTNNNIENVLNNANAQVGKGSR